LFNYLKNRKINEIIEKYNLNISQLKEIEELKEKNVLDLDLDLDLMEKQIWSNFEPLSEKIEELNLKGRIKKDIFENEDFEYNLWNTNTIFYDYNHKKDIDEEIILNKMNETILGEINIITPKNIDIINLKEDEERLLKFAKLLSIRKVSKKNKKIDSYGEIRLLYKFKLKINELINNMQDEFVNKEITKKIIDEYLFVNHGSKDENDYFLNNFDQFLLRYLFIKIILNIIYESKENKYYLKNIIDISSFDFNLREIVLISEIVIKKYDFLKTKKYNGKS